MHIIKLMAVTAAAALLLAGCEGTQQTRTEPEVEDRSAAPAPAPAAGSGASSVSTQALPGSGRAAPSPLDDPNSILASRIIYFDYDSSEIRPEDLPVVEAHARYLLSNPGAGILLEGHADERGSREYNVALGERRALSVAQVMQLLGVPANQLRTVSYGEERPQVDGHDEAAWQQNRRVELVY